jgi:hypothetical protein
MVKIYDGRERPQFKCRRAGVASDRLPTFTAPPVAHRRRDGNSATEEGGEHDVALEWRRHRSCFRLRVPTGRPLFYRS